MHDHNQCLGNSLGDYKTAMKPTPSRALVYCPERSEDAVGCLSCFSGFDCVQCRGGSLRGHRWKEVGGSPGCASMLHFPQGQP